MMGEHGRQPPPGAVLHVTSQSRARAICLVDVDPDLGDGLSAAELVHARRLVLLPGLELESGDWETEVLERTLGVRGHIHGFLLVSGALTLDVSVASRVCARLITPGELVLLDGLHVDSVQSAWGWSALEVSRLAIFDERLLAIGHHWPALLGAILTRAAAQTRQAHYQQAISQLPRVEDRLLALFWSLADRLGTAGTDGVRVPLPLKHDAIARMIGARRPTVTLGLHSLATRHLLVREPEGWLLDRRSLQGLTQPEAQVPTAASRSAFSPDGSSG